MSATGTLGVELSEAILSIDRGSEVILDANSAAERLLQAERDVIVGANWRELIASDRGPGGTLAEALHAANRTPLAPFILQIRDDSEVLVSGIVFPAGAERVDLLLWPLLRDTLFDKEHLEEGADIVATLGVDQLPCDASWGLLETSAFMADVQARLSDLLRNQDSVSLRTTAGIVLILRSADREDARNISRALLSQLHRTYTGPGGIAARFCIGLAKYGRRDSPLSTLAAAINALGVAQQAESDEEGVQFAAESDYALTAGRALYQGGEYEAATKSITAAASLPDAAQDSDQSTGTTQATQPPELSPIEKGIEGYVVDNMEGAVDQAIFMAGLDVPIAIVGPAGTGKMYVARIIHGESGGARDSLVQIDCREFRSRNSANTSIAQELARAEGKTLVFKSPHLMNADAQVRLARQVATRTRIDVTPPEYLPRLKLVALFPESLEVLVYKGELTEALASVFAGFPIHVPPIKDRKQAVLRWAHKMLGQEGDSRGRDMKGFTPDAEQAMLAYDWPGNISEMRRVLCDALDKTDKDWLTPVDLGLFRGISADGAPQVAQPDAFLSLVDRDDAEVQAGYVPTTLESLDAALGEAVHSMLESGRLQPLGSWLDDELVLAALDRYRGSLPKSAAYLHTRSRNISRWLPKIESREKQRTGSSLWQVPRRLLCEWVTESPRLEDSPMALLEDKLMVHVNSQGAHLSAAKRASIMGVSTPTFMKRLKASGHE